MPAASISNGRQGRPVFDPGRALGPQVYRHLRVAIIRMELRPGQALSEQEIAIRLGVSRQPVREAFIKLGEARLVRILPQRGTFVAGISLSEVINARFVRAAVETAVVRAACAVAPVSALDALDALIVLQSQAVQAGDQPEFLSHDEAFHRTLVESIDCSTAWSILEDAKVHMDRVRYLRGPEMTPLDILVKQHAAIVAAIRDRNSAKAVASMDEHLREVLRILPHLTKEYPDLFEDLHMPLHAAF